MVSLLSLLEGGLDGANEADIFVNDNTKSQDVLLGLAVVELADAELDIREAF